MNFRELVEGPDGHQYGIAAACARALTEHGVPNAHDRVRDWVRRGLLAPALEIEGRKVYRVADVHAIELATRRNSARGRTWAEKLAEIRSTNPELFMD